MCRSSNSTGYRFFLAVYVLPVSWLTRPYLIAIEPFRRFLLYPAVLRRIRRAWLEKYGGTILGSVLNKSSSSVPNWMNSLMGKVGI